jgi:hypothetical protein
MSENLWPSFEQIPDVTTPKKILLEQAGFLQKNSQNLLSAVVKSSTGQDGNGKEILSHRLNVVAPLLGDYTITILIIQHDLFMYPLSVISKQFSANYTVNDERQLNERLKTIFQNDKTIELISKMIQQSRIAKREQDPLGNI